jgi:hypothetical protein
MTSSRVFEDEQISDHFGVVSSFYFPGWSNYEFTFARPANLSAHSPQ